MFLTPIEPKTWPLTFLVVTQERYILDTSNYTFSESLWQEEPIGWFLTQFEQVWNLNLCKVSFSCQKLLRIICYHAFMSTIFGSSAALPPPPPTGTKHPIWGGQAHTLILRIHNAIRCMMCSHLTSHKKYCPNIATRAL